MLLRMVQAKISERVKSYAEQMVGLRKLFEAFDFNGDGVLDEEEFRECLERCNIQFDDAQVLGLFAYFDGSYSG
jgi:Ca2+-binding EF-hand superfamily protein